MFQTIKLASKLGKLEKRISKIVGKKNVESFLSKRKGLGKTRERKIIEYAYKKPKSTERRINRINKALDVAPYAATGTASVGAGLFLSRKDDKI